MNILQPKNIIVRHTPEWRPQQPELSHFTSKHRDGKTVEPTGDICKQFTEVELMRISRAVQYTKAMGNPSLTDGKD